MPQPSVLTTTVFFILYETAVMRNFIDREVGWTFMFQSIRSELVCEYNKTKRDPETMDEEMLSFLNDTTRLHVTNVDSNNFVEKFRIVVSKSLFIVRQCCHKACIGDYRMLFTDHRFL